MTIDNKTIYRFKKPYTSGWGVIPEGREITFLNNGMYIDGMIIPEPYLSEMKNLFSNDEFRRNYITEIKFKNSKWST